VVCEHVQARARSTNISLWIGCPELMSSIAWGRDLDATLRCTWLTILGAQVRELLGDRRSGHMIGVERAVGSIAGVQGLCAGTKHGRVHAGHLGNPWEGEGSVDCGQGEEEGLGCHYGRDVMR
jgi:hypothetical protein